MLGRPRNAQAEADRARGREHAAWSEEHGRGAAARIARAQRAADRAQERAARRLLGRWH